LEDGAVFPPEQVWILTAGVVGCTTISVADSEPALARLQRRRATQPQFAGPGDKPHDTHVAREATPDLRMSTGPASESQYLPRHTQSGVTRAGFRSRFLLEVSTKSNMFARTCERHFKVFSLNENGSRELARVSWS
jgi:hypothetical protein